MPTYENSSQATAEDHDTAAYNFAQQLISNEWVIGQCDNQVLLLYVEQQNKVNIAKGRNIELTYTVSFMVRKYMLEQIVL